MGSVPNNRSSTRGGEALVGCTYRGGVADLGPDKVEVGGVVYIVAAADTKELVRPEADARDLRIGSVGG